MKRLVALTACPTGIAHPLNDAAEDKRAAATMGHKMQEQNSGLSRNKRAADRSRNCTGNIILLAGRIYPRRPWPVLPASPVHWVSTAEAIRKRRGHKSMCCHFFPRRVSLPFQRAAPVSTFQPKASAAATPAIASLGGKRLVCFAACQKDITHTFMAAEMAKSSQTLGHTIKVETQGSVGAKNQLTPEDIAAADAVVIAADTKVDTSRFAGKPLYTTSTKEAMHSGKEVIAAALAQPVRRACHPKDRSNMRKRSGPGPAPVPTSI